MGTVYLALDRKHGRHVAVKVLPPELGAVIGLERFQREIAIAARLSHPLIVPLHDSGQAGGLLYYVMPYVDGESLRARLDRTPPPTLEQALGFARDLADALAYAHASGVIHRDVKPENVLLHEDHALLTDFGVARATGDAALSDSGLPVGTALYSSPEQAAGSRSVDAASDVYSLGCVLWEMLAASGAPGDGGASKSRLERRFAEPLPPLHQGPAEVPEWIDAVVRRATAARPDDRFATAAEFGRALTRPPTVGAYARPPRPRSRRLWLGGGTALVLFLAALTVRPRHAVAPDARAVVVASFENRTGDPALTALGDMAGDYIARGLATTGLVHDVYDARSRAREAGDTVQRGPIAARTLARQLGAGTVVAARYYLLDDSLRFEAQLLDARTGRLILSLAPVVGNVADRMRVVEMLRQRVMAGFAASVSSEFDPWLIGRVPPTYDAYRETLAAEDAAWTFDFDRAAEGHLRAARLDTNYTAALGDAVVALALAGRCASIDSLARLFDSRRWPPSRPERAQLDYATASCRHDAEAVRTASQAVLAALPRSVGASVLGAVASWATNRPREALAILHRVDPEAMHLSGDRLGVFLDWQALIYHQLGLYQEQLATARAGLDRVPGQTHLELDEASALAGLGRSTEAERLALGWLVARAPDDRWSGQRAECLALELRAHGDAQGARRVLDAVSAWYSASGAESAETDDNFVCIWALYSPSYYAGRNEKAERDYARLLGRNPGSTKAHAALGALAARRGDRRTAARMDRWLAQRNERLADLGRARIAVILGDRARALELLRAAHARGLAVPDHIDPDLEPLHGDPVYQALFRPRG